MSAPGRVWPGALALAALVGAGLAAAAFANGYYVFAIATAALTAIVGVGLNVLIGLTGQVSFGHVGFFAVGAYAVGALTLRAGLDFWLAWPIAVVLSAALGALLAVPALRARGPYLAMITIAFGFVVEHVCIEWRGVTGGQNGLMGIASPSIAGTRLGERGIAALAIVLAAVATLAYARFAAGPWGIAMRAVRDAETAAGSIGLHATRIRAAAFVISAALAGLAGGLFAALSGFIAPSSFSFQQSILFVLVVILGGAGSVAGPVVGALVVVMLPELLSALAEYRLLLFGAMLLGVLWIAPGGIAGAASALWARIAERAAGGTGRATGSATASETASASAPASTSASAAPSPVAHRPASADRADSDHPVVPIAPETGGLVARGLSLSFGGLRAVDAVDLEAPGGRITSLIGPNGAGKTSVLNMLSGFYAPQAGTVTLGGAAIGGLPSWAIARAGLARTYQTSQLFGTLSVLDNVAIALCRGRLGASTPAGSTDADGAPSRARALLEFVGLRGDLSRPASALAHVDRRLVEIARALAPGPSALLLDEPAAGLSGPEKAELGALLRRIADRGLAVVLVEHDMSLVMGVSDRIVVLDAGRRIGEGTPAQVQADPAVRRAYLGAEAGRPVARRSGSGEIGQELLGVGRLVARHGAVPALRAVDLTVRSGELVAVLGANGAGKSTLMRAIAGLHRPVEGGIAFEGRELASMPAHRVVRAGIVLVPEGRQVFPELSVLDNLRLGAYSRGTASPERIESMLARFPRLRERLGQRAGLLSGGEQQMLAIARGLMSEPRLLMLDEPSLGLAPAVIEDLFETLDRLRGERLTILLVDQLAPLALALADRAFVLAAGRVVASGDAARIASDPVLDQAYLGGSGPPIAAAAG